MVITWFLNKSCIYIHWLQSLLKHPSTARLKLKPEPLPMVMTFEKKREKKKKKCGV